MPNNVIVDIIVIAVHHHRRTTIINFLSACFVVDLFVR